MRTSAINLGQLSAASNRFMRRLLTIGENRLELLMVEVQEERVRLVRAILLALGAATMALLGGITLTAAIVVLFWARSPLGVLLILTALYAGAAGYIYQRLTVLLRDWENLPATLEQLRKDRACLENTLK